MKSISYGRRIPILAGLDGDPTNRDHICSEQSLARPFQIYSNDTTTNKIEWALTKLTRQVYTYLKEPKHLYPVEGERERVDSHHTASRGILLQQFFSCTILWGLIYGTTKHESWW